MIKYRCDNCQGLICETSTCPICSERTVISENKIFWCECCNIPIFDENCDICNNKGIYIGTDIRPVFPEERLLIEVILGKPFEFANKSIWNTSGNNYIVDGQKIRFSVKETVSKFKADEIRDDILKNKKDNAKYEKDFYNNEYIEKFIKANKIRLNLIINEASQYIRNSVTGYNDDEMFVSFSGGKDSTVTSDLVINALRKENIIHIYGDTTLEYPETENYLKRFREKYSRTPILIAKNKEQEFNELCKVIGPPSRVMRWCCTIFKTGAITRKIESTFKDKRRVLTFYGVRRSESASRNKYDRESDSPKITKQKVVSPIIDWLDFDIWLYILTKKIDFNYAYRLGFARVGCWCCPNNSSWAEFLSSIYMDKQYRDFNDILIDFAKRIGKPDPEDYIGSGGWKARQGGNGLEYSKNAIVQIKPCALAENTFNFELNKPISIMLYEFFKPFGIVNNVIGNKRLNEIYILSRKTNEPILKLSGRIGQSVLKVSIIKFTNQIKDIKTAERLIKKQITKYQTCIGCLACESVCKYNAIKISNINDTGNIDYKIKEDKCTGCLECVNHFDGGCYMKKVLRTKKGEI